MKKVVTMVASAALGLGVIASAAMAIPPTEYLRKGDQVIVVFENSGKLYCRRTADNFELCNGMEKQADGTWTGDKMKHPDMPKFMTFNGTVTFSDGGLNIKGCAMGQSLCDAEDWVAK